VKSQLILQFILDLVSEGKTSGKLLSEHIKERSELELSERSIRYHVDQLGLNEIKKEVSACLTNLKKNSSG
jgi:repressor of nif and glnA expression